MLQWFRDLKTWQKGAVVVGALALISTVVGGGVVVGRQVKGLIQNNPAWGRLQLGKGSSTIGAGGCLLTAFTIIYNAFFGKNATPPELNAIGVSRGCFDGSLLKVEEFAEALGLIVIERIRNAPSDVGGMIAIIDEILVTYHGFAVLHVDYEGDTDGDHFIVITGKTATGYTAVDPVNGATIQLSKALRGASKWGSVVKNYVPFGAFTLLKR